jgi:hypothetical protein
VEAVPPWHHDASSRWLKDGGGLPSNGDWSVPREETDSLAEWRSSLRTLALERDLLRRLQLRVSLLMSLDEEHAGVTPEVLHEVPEELKAPLVTEEEGLLARRALMAMLESRGFPAMAGAEAGQPYHLNLCRALARAMGDADVALFDELSGGVNTGYFEPIRPSGIWRPSTKPRPDGSTQRLWCEGNWKSAEEEPAKVKSLMDKYVEKGKAVRWFGTKEDADARWPQGTARGCLGLAKQAGKEDRVTGDMTVSGVTDRCFMPEDTEVPSLWEVACALSTNDSDCEKGAPQLAQIILDIQGAHMTIKIREYDQGLQFFGIGDCVYRWVVCHFGARYASWWWARLGAFVIRLVHRMIRDYHFAFLYVDDLNAMVNVQGVWLDAAVLVLMLVALGVPLSWHKLRVSMEQLKYIGLQVDPCRRILSLPEDKLVKAQRILSSLVPGKRVYRKELEKGVCFLMWIAGIAVSLKPWLAAFYNNLSRPAVANVKLTLSELREVGNALSGSDMSVCKNCLHGRIKYGWRVLTVGGYQARNRNDLLQPPKLSNGFASVEFSSKTSTRTRVSEESGFVAKLWLHALEGFPRLKRCYAPAPVMGSGAADAWAEGTRAGIGGWWSTSDHPSIADIHWFSLEFDTSLMPRRFEISRNANSDISFYEALAQAVLLERRLACTRCLTKASISMKHVCDNQGVVGASVKLFSTKKPICYALQLLSAVAARRGAEVRIMHIEGESNSWADKLSRPSEYPEFQAWLDPAKCHAVDLNVMFYSVWGDLLIKEPRRRGK